MPISDATLPADVGVPASHRGARAAALLVALAIATGTATGESVVSVVADFDDGNTTPTIVEVQNVALADCTARVGGLPTHSGANALILDIAAPAAGAVVTCELVSRAAASFDDADAAGIWYWLEKGRAGIALRFRDAAGQVLHTKPVEVGGAPKWQRVSFPLGDDDFVRVGNVADPTEPWRPAWPLEIVGASVQLQQAGRQRVIFDDMEVSHEAAGPELLRGQITLGDPTHCFEPGAKIPISVRLENLSRRSALPISVELELFDFAGASLGNAKSSINLPRSSAEFRAYQDVPFNAELDEAGVFRFVARASTPGWRQPVELESAILVAPSNRTIPRGRETFFGVHTACANESPNDLRLEASLLERLGVQHVLLDVNWEQLEPRRGSPKSTQLGPFVDACGKAGIAVSLRLTAPPDWLAAEADPAAAATRTLAALADQMRRRVRGYCAPPVDAPLSERIAAAADALGALRAANADAVILVEAELEDALAAASDGLRVPDGVELALRVEGDAESLHAALDRLQSAPRDLRRRTRLLVQRPPGAAIGAAPDAIACFAFLIRAANSDLLGVALGDLRDDARDPRRTDQMSGLFRRDFSPRAETLGFSNAVAFIAGLTPAGALAGAPAGYDSSLFIGGARQVAILAPRADAHRPALLAPQVAAPGLLTVVDFARTPAPPIEVAGLPAVRTPPGPVVLEYIGERAHAEPMIQLATPVVAAPADVRCETAAQIEVTVSPPPHAPAGYVQLQLPLDSGLRSTFSAARLDGGGQPQRFTIPLERVTPSTATAPSGYSAASLRITFGAEATVIPIRILPD